MKCSRCKKSIQDSTNPHKPFCSARCKLEDLGAWSDESYRIPEKPREEDGETWIEEGLS